MEPLSLKLERSFEMRADSSGSSDTLEDASYASVPSTRDSLELPADMKDWSKEEHAAYTALRSKRKKCCVGGCTHRSLPIARSYHQLPVRNREVWEKWIEVIRWSRNEPDWLPNGDAAPLVCSRHFAEADFISYEASSRVRLSHTALPVYYVDPADGTVMDRRFDNPLPIPMLIPGPNRKDLPKKPLSQNPQQVPKMDSKIPLKKKINVFIPSAHHPDGIEQVTEENDVNPGAGYSYLLQHLQAQSLVNKPMTQINVHPNPALAMIPNPNSLRRKLKKNVNGLSKPPALIRAFPRDNELPIRTQFKPHLVQNNIFKGSFGGHVPSPVTQQRSQPSKHKLGLAKCRHIVQTLENEMKLAKQRLAGELDIPYQVVNGVWNMRDSLKDKL